MSLLNEQVCQLKTARHEHYERNYREALDLLPAPGYGDGTHARLLGVANHGVRAGHDVAEICADLRAAVPTGRRHIADSEIRQAVEKAARDGGVPPATAARTAKASRVLDGRMRDALITAGKGTTEDHIRECSPVKVPHEPEGMAITTLSCLFGENEYVFVGERYGSQVKTAQGWIDEFRRNRVLGPHVIPNPLTGAPGKTKDGKTSFRSDDCVSDFRYAVVEFDDLSREDQLAFWATIDLPIVALIDSGNKSIHAWVRVDCQDRRAWERDVEMGLYAQRLVPLGVDPMCRTEARLSRMPGYYRYDKGTFQELLYLSCDGKAVKK